MCYPFVQQYGSTRVGNLLINRVEINMVEKSVIYYYVKSFAGSVSMYSWPSRPRSQRNGCFMSSHGLNHQIFNNSRFLQDIPHLELFVWLISMIL